MSSTLLSIETSALLIVDVQEKFLPGMHDPECLMLNLSRLIQGAERLNVPIVVTEQYPQGLGHTVAPLNALLPVSAKKLEKRSFGAMAEPGFLPVIQAAGLSETGRRQIILCGIEAHICVNQTAHQLLQGGFQVHLVQDAISSRTAENRQIGIHKMVQAGVIPTSTEMVLFELLETAAHPEFKFIQSLIK